MQLTEIKVNVIPDNNNCLVGIRNVKNVLLEILAEKKKTKDREGLDFLILLDNSGSMTGESIGYAKEAIIELINYLPNKDNLSFIAYSDYCKLIFKNENTSNKEKLINNVKCVHASGGTNISLALETAHELLKNNNNSLKKQIFLFSDGNPQQGITTQIGLEDIARKISADGITISSFGIGNHFNEGIMKGISTCGEGDYFYIKNADKIKSNIAISVDKMIHVICTNTNIKLRGKNSCIVTKFISHYEGNLMNGLKIGDIISFDKKMVLAEIEILPREAKSEVEVLTYDLSFTRNNEVEHIKGSLTLDFIEDVINNDINPIVESQLELYNAILQNKVVEKLIADNKIDDAKKLINNTIEILEKYKNIDIAIFNIISTLKKSLENLSKNNDVKEFTKNCSYNTVRMLECTNTVIEKKIYSEEEEGGDIGFGLFGEE